MTPFDLENTALDGVHLIEAGAGTGKTYTIAGLFLRLIVEQGLAIDRILVVTYTKSATEELKSRIRLRLLEAKEIFGGRRPAEPMTDAMIRHGVSPRLALRRIQDALVGFDQAAIFTIHGFCQRLLQHFAFETGHLFEAELVQDAQPLIQEVADDYWRRYVSRAPDELAGYVVDRLKGPQGWVDLFQHSRFPGLRLLPEASKPALTGIAPWRAAARQVVRQWPEAREEVLALLHSEGLHANVYGAGTPDSQRPSITKRMRKVGEMIGLLDQWQGDYPLFKGFEKVTQSSIDRYTKKNHPPLRHPFFQWCDHALACHTALEDQLAAYLRYLKIKFLQQAGQRLTAKKHRRNILFFDDLLLQVYDALDSDRRTGLVAAIRVQYQAALVDEFQDTDPLQYAIFDALFAGGQPLLFMIGDPKQAIYSFRGADIFSYLQARRNARQRHTLTRNWRATAPLIDALNTLFAAHPCPFGFDQIPYEAAVAADTTVAGQEPPFVLWHLTRSDSGDVHRPIPRSEAVPRIVAAVAEEITRLLSDPESAIVPEQIAVLTRTHYQAQAVKAALSRRRVPAVLHSAGRVFDTPEARELTFVLSALASPADPRKVRTALATSMIGADAATLCASVEQPNETWQVRWARFDGYHQLWLRYGFYRMFSHFMAQEGIKARLLGLPDGDRRLTNLLHLAELLHQADQTYKFGPEGMLKWLTAQRQAHTAAGDAEMLRLESDAHAVRIITIHKSKGLQFEVVFCPFTWEGVKIGSDTAVFHDPGAGEQLTLAIGPGLDPEHQQQAAAEALSENLRLLYVALTRARLRCYMVWGCIRETELSAPAYLFHSPLTPIGTWMTDLQTKMKSMTDTDMLAELRLLADRSEGAIAIAPLPEPGSVRYAHPGDRSVPLHRRRFERSLGHGWRVASFSAMTAGLSPEEADRPDRDATASDVMPLEPAPEGFERLADFPKGASAGLFFHDLLERWDFTQSTGPARGTLVSDTLTAHGFDVRWTETVDRMLTHLAAALLPVPAGDLPLQLSRVPAGRRVNEMEFYFPLKRVIPQQLKQLFADHGRPHMADLPADPLDRLNFAPMHGYLKGYIDTIFFHDRRYYLVDWKSNHLGDTPEAYTADRLAHAMAEAYYFLQYHLYVVALDQLLRTRVPDYLYEQHFGGVYYLFLRGIQGPTNGIFHSVPDPGLVKDLRELFIGGGGQSNNP